MENRPRKRFSHFPNESQVLVVRPCSFAATWSRLPCGKKKKKVRKFLLQIYLGLLRFALLQNLAGPNNALDLVDHQRANTHYGSIRQHLVRRSWRARGIQLVGIHTLFADQAIVSVVGVVGITRNCAAAVSYGLEIEFYQPHRSARKSQGSWMRHGKPNRETHARIAQSDPSCEANVSDCP